MTNRADQNTDNRNIGEIKTNDTETQACTQRFYEVTAADLPLSCPPRTMRVWDAHPRVYLPIAELGEVVCPYCDARFKLQTEN